MSQDIINKNLVAFVIERVLLDINDDTYELVKKRLLDDYKIFFTDCYGKPEYLRKILKDVFGDSSITIIGNIAETLKNHSIDTKVEKFVKILSK
ncbi:MAG: hypothetical protein ACT4OW_04530 [Nitrososphaerota archaeon]